MFTANFVGEVNFLRGIITKVSERFLVRIEDGTQLICKDRDGGVGDRVVVAFRPEFASIGDRELENRLSGNVMDTLYSGSILRIKIKLASGDQIVVKKAISFEKNQFDVGDQVTVNVSPQHILVYPHPEKGLDQELALE
jgi:ABC-type Fe3+/spermidine/putrescine transport system ATPase subunit